MKTRNAIPPERSDNLWAYLSRIVRNLSFDRLRAANAKKRDAVLVPLSEELDDCFGGDLYEEAPSKEETARHLDAFLDSLGDREKTAFLHRCFYGESVTRIA